ncbi:MAG: type II toxin-antitoxin system Phd/YefM family antitoxin [Deltaproteobacteria bacterium]|nr:type II toxin-antitoxin system Phd/YefM family antitoxin [Deltaproteobacteria bacterium]
MEEQYTIAEAKNKLSSIVHAVEQGAPVKLTRHGRPVAVLLSINQYDRLSHKKEGYWRALKSFRKLIEKEDTLISDEDFQGLRDDSPGRKVDLK